MRAIIGAFSLPNRAIGMNGKIPWMNKMPADLRFFRETTRNSTAIMGRATWESLPEKNRPLPNRQNIILSRTLQNAFGAEIARNLDEAFDLAINENIFIIGGEMIYREAIRRAKDLNIDEIFATEIYGEFDGDAFFPEIPSEFWREMSRKKFKSDEKNLFNYDFVKYERKK